MIKTFSSTDSELSLSDSHFTNSDDDDNEEMEEGDESDCLSSTTAGNDELQAEFGTEIIGNSMHVFPFVSSGIAADCSTQGDDNDFELPIHHFIKNLFGRRVADDI